MTAQGASWILARINKPGSLSDALCALSLEGMRTRHHIREIESRATGNPGASIRSTSLKAKARVLFRGGEIPRGIINDRRYANFRGRNGPEKSADDDIRRRRQTARRRSWLDGRTDGRTDARRGAEETHYG